MTDAPDQPVECRPFWLRELVRITPVPFPWPAALRCAICVASAWAIHTGTGGAVPLLWMALAAMLAAFAEPDGGYRMRLRQVATAAAIGALGALTGYLAVLPWGMVVASMAMLGVAAGIVSGLGQRFSYGALQFLLLSAIALGLPTDVPPWEQALLFACGGGLSVLLLAGEAALRGGEARRRLAAQVADDLAALARLRADALMRGDDPFATPDAMAAARRAVIAIDSLATEMPAGCGARTVAGAIAANAPALYAAILASRDVARLEPASDNLREIARSLRGLASAGDGSVTDLLCALAGGRDAADRVAASVAGIESPRAIERLADPGLVRGAIALGLCLAVAYSLYWLRQGDHWFWVPLTVAVVMKRDFGSLFARAVWRAAGTVAGAALGALLLTTFHGTPLMLAVLVLAALLPWGKRLSYAVMSAVLTAYVLILVATLDPEASNLDYARIRIIDTAIGSAIVLLFGYLAWIPPRDRLYGPLLRQVGKRVGAYLLAVATPHAEPGRFGRSAYEALAHLRRHLMMQRTEPPPRSILAAERLLLADVQDRICARVTAFAATAHPHYAGPEADALRALVVYAAASPNERSSLPSPAYDGHDQQVARLVTDVVADITAMDRT